MSDDEAPAYEPLKVHLKPRCNLGAITKEFMSDDDLQCVELNVWRDFLEQAVESDIEKMFDALAHLPSLKKLTIMSRGSGVQVIPVYLLTHVVGEAEGLEELYLTHIKLQGHSDDLEDLAAAFGEHQQLRVLELSIENIQDLSRSVAAAAQIPTLEIASIQTAEPPLKTEDLAAALEYLVTSKSLKKLTLINIALRYEDLAEMTKLLGVNHVLEELTIQIVELDATGGESIVQMLMAGPALKKLNLKMDTMEEGLTPEFIKALDHNPNIDHFELLLDGRMSDMRVARRMSSSFRDELKGKYKSTCKVGMTLGVLCERIINA